MKHRARYFICLCGVLLLSFFFLTGSEAAKSYCKILNISGKVQVLRSGAAAWSAAAVGMSLEPGDGVKTGGNAQAEVVFDRGSSNIVRVEPNTQIKIWLHKKVKLELSDGEVLSAIRKLPRGSSFEIRTPTAVCGARGTVWITNVAQGRTTIKTFIDTVYARGIDKAGRIMEEKMNIPEGFKTVVERFKRPAKLVEINRTVMENFRKTGIIAGPAGLQKGAIPGRRPPDAVRKASGPLPGRLDKPLGRNFDKRIERIGRRLDKDLTRKEKIITGRDDTRKQAKPKDRRRRRRKRKLFFSGNKK